MRRIYEIVVGVVVWGLLDLWWKFKRKKV